MKLINKNIFLAICLLAGSFMSCDNDLEEINVNPNQSTENPSVDLLFGSIVPGFVGQVISSYATPGQFVQQFANLNSDEGTLTQDDDAISRGAWESSYSGNGGALRNIELLKLESEKQGNDTYFAVANILKVYMLSYATDVFGDIPYSNAGQGFRLEERHFSPSYDAQETVYTNMLADLESANTLLANSSDAEIIDEERDVLFEGDKLAWRKFSNSLRLRLLMRISDAKDVTEDVAAIFNAPADFPVFESVDDQPAFSFTSIENWPFRSTLETIDRIRLSATFVDIMKGEGGDNDIADIEDPRLSWLINPSDASVALGTPEFVGQPVGLASDTRETAETSMLSERFKDLNTFWLMTYAELNFIKAEAIQRGMISGSAADAYEMGIMASISKYGIDVTSTASTDYVADVLTQFTGNEIKHIAIQRWLDQPNSGFEGYAVWRRMDFPTLELGPDVIESQIPTRYFYSVKTTERNQTNADIAINRAPLNGQNTTFQKVWWDTK